MRSNKIIGTLIILIGVFILLYKDGGFYGFGGYVDKSLENIILRLIIMIIGFLFIKKSKRIN